MEFLDTVPSSVQPFIITVVVFLAKRNGFKKFCSEFLLVLDNPKLPVFVGKLRDEDLNCFLCCLPNLLYLVLLAIYGVYLLVKSLLSAILVVGSVVPVPALTHLYRFYLAVESHLARSRNTFREDIVQIEKDIKKHEALGNQRHFLFYRVYSE